MSSKEVAIVVPFYRPINETEKVAFYHLNHFLGKYDKYFAVPQSLPKNKIPSQDFNIVRYPDKYFTSVRSYSTLMVTQLFYQQFIDYQYILVYQLDSLVFSDELKYWCDMGFDYLGAPNYSSVIGFLSHSQGYPSVSYNGGFSLRKVSTALVAIQAASAEAQRHSNDLQVQKQWFFKAALMGQTRGKWLKAKPQCYPFNEDGFWTFEAPKYLSKYKIPDIKTALRFAFEKNPQKSFVLNNKHLPFGCHAWSRYDKNFWVPYLLKTN